MAEITTRAEFISYCKRRLGSPVINIEVDDTQVDDRVDDAIDYWIRNHMDGSERTFYVHTITQAEIDAQTITIPESIFEVHNIVPWSTSNSHDMFSVRYQVRLQDFAYFRPIDSLSYFIRASYWDYINELLSEGTSINFSKYKTEVRLDMAASSLFVADESQLVFDVQKAINPADYPKAWNDEILKRYATAQIKRQWGENLKKFAQISLPGNVTMNGEALYQEAVQEITDIEGEMREKYQLPPMFVMG